MTVTTKTLTLTDLAAEYQGEVSDTAAPSLSPSDYLGMGMIIIADDGDLLDGYHRVSGLLAALSADNDQGSDVIRVVVLSSDDTRLDAVADAFDGDNADAIASVLSDVI